MTITQPVSNNKASKVKPKPENTQADSRAQETSYSQNSALMVQHTSNVAPIPGQNQLQLHQSSLPWWAWGPAPPPNPWNLNMWSSGAFQQLSLTNPPGQHNVLQLTVTPNQFADFPRLQLWPLQQLPTDAANTGQVQRECHSQGQENSPQQSLAASSNYISPVSNPPDNTKEEQPDPLVSTLSFSMAPGKLLEPLLSMHVSASIKKRIWAGQYIDLAYLLGTQPVPDDDKAYEFSCSNSNTNKLSLTTVKPKVKVDSYNSWNKAFRVLTEIVTLKWPDQCLPMVQYAAEISDNIEKFTFVAIYNYDIKFRLKKQMKPAFK